MKYTLNSIDDGVANVTYADGSWAQFVVTKDMQQADIGDQPLERGDIHELPCGQRCAEAGPLAAAGR